MHVCQHGINNCGCAITLQKLKTQYNFIFMDTGLKAVIPRFSFTFYDFDHGTLSYGVNSLLNGASGAMVDDPQNPNQAQVPCKDPAPGLSYMTVNEINPNGLDGVIERLHIDGYDSYTIPNEGKMCNVRTAPDKTALKITVPDSNTNSPTGGYSPVGDPSFYWLQDQNYYCNKPGDEKPGVDAPMNPSWMYTNWPCTELFLGTHDGQTTFESTVRGYGCDNPHSADPSQLGPVAQARLVSVNFKGKDSFTTWYEIESSSCYSYMTGGRNFLFSGFGQKVCPSPPPAPPLAMRRLYAVESTIEDD
jgi:hypothetical protein